MIYRSLSWWTYFPGLTKTIMERNKYHNLMRDLNTAGRDVTASFLANLVQYNLMGLAQERGINLPRIPRRGLDGPSMGQSGNRGWNDNEMNNRFNDNNSQPSMGRQGFSGTRYNQNSLNVPSRNSSINNEFDDGERPFRLSGACRRWNQRYLKQGYNPQDAMKKALQHSDKYRGILQSNSKSRPTFISDLRRREIERKSRMLASQPENDQYRRGLSGAGVKWYVRFLEQGIKPKEARKRVDERQTLALSGKSNKDSKTVSNDNAVKYERVCIVPKDPKAYLTSDDLTAIEDAIIAEVALGWKHKLQFSGIHVRPGLLLIYCAVPHTAEWIKLIIPNLKNWNGIPIKTCSEDEIPTAQVVSVVLPKSAGQALDVVLKIIELKNEGLSTKDWVIVGKRDNDEALHITFSIDDATKAAFKKMNWKLSYKSGKVTISQRNKEYEGFVRDIRSSNASNNESTTEANQEGEENPDGEEHEVKEEMEDEEEIEEKDENEEVEEGVEYEEAEDMEEQENDGEAVGGDQAEDQMGCDEDAAEEVEEDVQDETLE